MAGNDKPRANIFTHLTPAKYLDDYRVWLSFNDGAAGEVNLEPELSGELFEPLKDQRFFRTFKLEGHTLAWSNGAEFTPELLREQIVGTE